jgi:hypothetical protein
VHLGLVPPVGSAAAVQAAMLPFDAAGDDDASATGDEAGPQA